MFHVSHCKVGDMAAPIFTYFILKRTLTWKTNKHRPCLVNICIWFLKNAPKCLVFINFNTFVVALVLWQYILANDAKWCLLELNGLFILVFHSTFLISTWTHWQNNLEETPQNKLDNKDEGMQEETRAEQNGWCLCSSCWLMLTLWCTKRHFLSEAVYN